MSTEMGKSGPPSTPWAWELAGVVFISVCGSLLHFVYDWTGRSSLLGLVVPVNESVWEHLKLGLWSLLIYTALEYPFIRRRVHGFAVGKLLGITVMEVFIVAVFYTYTAIVGREFLAVDIGSFVAGAALCQLTAIAWMRRRSRNADERRARLVGWAGLALIAALFMLFTYVTPRLPIFMDSTTGEYGASWNGPK